MLDAFILRHVWMHILQHDPVSCKVDIDISPVRSLQSYQRDPVSFCIPVSILRAYVRLISGERQVETELISRGRRSQSLPIKSATPP